MNLDDAQRKKVSEWIAQGLKLSDIQTRLANELGVKLTYMDVRFLVDDLKLTPKDEERPKNPTLPGPGAAPGPGAPGAAATMGGKSAAPTATASTSPGTAKSGGVSVSVDPLARAGTIVSGKATFSDGNTADWYVDQTGRLGMVPKTPGYRPPAADVPQLQALLDQELIKMGL